MLCYKCGSHVPDTQTACSVCGQKVSAVSVRQVSSGYSRRAMNLAAEGGLFKLEERIAERYIVRELLGEGPTGFSYGVDDDVLKTNIRLKIIHPNLLQTADEQKQFNVVLERFSRLSHPNLSRIFEVGTAKGRMFYTQQQAEGLSLRRIMDERLLKGNLFSCKEVEPILAQLVHALEAVHKIGAHLNLKPENIFVLPDLLKLTDVGLGLAIPRLPFVQAQRMHRSENYFAPEFLSGMEITSGADVYSLGVILGEMLAGVLPDGGVPSLSRNNPSVPADLEVIYRKAIAASPLVRYRSIAEFYSGFSSFYKYYEEESKGRASVNTQKQETSSPSGASLFAVTEDVSATQSFLDEVLGVEAEKEKPKNVWLEYFKQFRWAFVALGGLLLIALVYVVFRDSTPEDYTGRNVEGFLQPSSEAPLTAPKNEVAKVVSAETQRGVNTNSPSFHTEAVLPEFLDETPRAPPASPPPSPSRPPPLPEPRRAPAQRANVPPAPPAAAEALRCPEQMRRIPAGSFKMGTAKDDAYLSFEDLPAASKETESFCMDIYEYPNRAGQMPQVSVSWDKAKELCQKQNKRLCTEAEWEKACRGGQGLRWPYGNLFEEEFCNAENKTKTTKALAASGKFPRCASPYAVVDMSGNAAEWVEEKVLKGGSFSTPDYGVRCAARKARVTAAAETGFRCCANLK